jgi:hypothetical protein
VCHANPNPAGRVPADRNEENTMNTDEKKAIIYARWLAERDKMPLPEHADTAIEWAEPVMRDGTKAERVKSVTFTGERYAVTIKLLGWAYDPTPMEGPLAGEP